MTAHNIHGSIVVCQRTLSLKAEGGLRDLDNSAICRHFLPLWTVHSQTAIPTARMGGLVVVGGVSWFLLWSTLYNKLADTGKPGCPTMIAVPNINNMSKPCYNSIPESVSNAISLLVRR